MTESKRERIPGLYSGETEGPATVLFFFFFFLKVGIAESSASGRRARRPRRNVDLDKVSQVRGGSANYNLIAETGCFVFDSPFYGEPVLLLKKSFGVFCSTRLKDELGSRVLYLLERFDDCLWIACQQGIAVV